MGQEIGRRQTSLRIYLKIIGVGALGAESRIAVKRTSADFRPLVPTR